MRSSQSQEERLLDDYEDVSTHWDAGHPGRPKLEGRSTHHVCLLAYIGVSHLLFLLTGILLFRGDLACGVGPQRFFLPGPDAITYVVQPEFPKEPQRYAGQPDPEIDDAWNELMLPSFFSATKEEILNAGHDLGKAIKVAEPDGGGYVASLSVWHDLHCLNQWRMFMHRDYYYENFTRENLLWIHEHFDHCIESLRLSTMCHADTSLHTFMWHDDTGLTGVDAVPSPRRQCVNWNQLYGVMRARVIAEGANPNLVMPSGEYQRTGM